jgi:hypothetical protein
MPETYREARLIRAVGLLVSDDGAVRGVWFIDVLPLAAGGICLELAALEDLLDVVSFFLSMLRTHVYSVGFSYK